MANITTADVAYATVDRVVSAPGRFRTRVTLTFPSTNLQYVAGGVPLLSVNFGSIRGIVAAIKVIEITPSATASMNPVWQWNGSTTAPKLVALREAAAVADGVPFDELNAGFSFGANSQIVTVEAENG